MPLPDPPTLAWVEALLGPFRVDSHFAHSHGYSKLWRLAAGSDHVWLKMHAHPHKWAGEVHALTRWAGPLMPTVLGWREDPPTVLLTEMPGVDAESIDFSPAAEERLWSEAGDWLHRFHTRVNPWMGDVRPDGSPGERHTNDPAALIQKGFDARLAQASDLGLLDAAEASEARKRFEEGLPALDGASAHSIHRDFHPRNWLTHPSGALAAVIDFEHARWDVRAADLNRPWDKEFHRNPRLIDAFFSAYGHPDDRFMAQIQTLRLYNLVTGTAWAYSVGDAEFCRFNQTALRRLIASRA